LSVYNKEGDGGFTDRDAELATFFANQAAAAIESARLYEQTREYAVVEERNRLARDLHDSVTQSLFSVTLLSEATLNLLERDPSKARARRERTWSWSSDLNTSACQPSIPELDSIQMLRRRRRPWACRACASAPNQSAADC